MWRKYSLRMIKSGFQKWNQTQYLFYVRDLVWGFFKIDFSSLLFFFMSFSKNYSNEFKKNFFSIFPPIFVLFCLFLFCLYFLNFPAFLPLMLIWKVSFDIFFFFYNKINWKFLIRDKSKNFLFCFSKEQNCRFCLKTRAPTNAKIFMYKSIDILFGDKFSKKKKGGAKKREKG